MRMKKRSWLKSAMLLPMAFAVQSAMAVNIAPVEDTFARGGKHAQKFYSSKPTLVVKNSENVDFDRKSYLTFDLSRFDRAQLESAKLRLFVKSAKKAVSLNVMQASGSWEGKINWETAPSANPGNGVAILRVPQREGGWVEVDITSLAQNAQSEGLSLVLEGPQADKKQPCNLS